MNATAVTQNPFLPRVEKPKGAFWRLSYYFMRKKFGVVVTPASVFSVRMPLAFTAFYGKVGRLDKKLELDHDLALLIRERVASLNGCLFCMDASRAAALERSEQLRRRLDELSNYDTSALFTAHERAALTYVTELTTERFVEPETFAQLAAHFDEREICDLVYVVASEHMFNLSNIGLNIGSDNVCQIKAQR